MTLRGWANASILSHQSVASNKSSTSFFSENSGESQDFTVLASVKKDAQQLEFPRTYHPEGFLLAMPQLVRLISYSEDSVIAAGGRPFKKEGKGFVQLNRKVTSQKIKELSLSQGKLKVYKLIEGNTKLKEFSLNMQRLYEIKYLSDEATYFTLSFVKRRTKKKGVLQSMSNVAANIGRGSGRGSLRQKQLKPKSVSRSSGRLSSFRLSRAKKKEETSPQQRQSLSSLRIVGRKPKRKTLRGRKKNTSSLADSQSTGMNPKPSSSSAKKTNSKRDLLVKDETNPNEYVDIDIEEYEFRFSSNKECKEWLVGIIATTENQARLFENYAQRLKTQRDNYEIVLRKSIDLLTIAKGVRNDDVWRLREKLAKFLEKQKKEEEAKIWYNLSYPRRQDLSILDMIENAEFSKKFEKQMVNKRSNSLTSFGSLVKVKCRSGDRKVIPPSSKELAINSITQFLEIYALPGTVKSASDEANELVRKHSYLAIARLFEAKYSRVPEGFEFYLIAAAKTPLEKLRDVAEDFEDLLEV